MTGEGEGTSRHEASLSEAYMHAGTAMDIMVTRSDRQGAYLALRSLGRAVESLRRYYQHVSMAGQPEGDLGRLVDDLIDSIRLPDLPTD